MEWECDEVGLEVEVRMWEQGQRGHKAERKLEVGREPGAEGKTRLEGRPLTEIPLKEEENLNESSDEAMYLWDEGSTR